MHILAEKWDDKHNREVKRHTVKNGKYIPIWRPCDLCGGLVEVGFIHDQCAAKERDKLLDIIY